MRGKVEHLWFLNISNHEVFQVELGGQLPPFDPTSSAPSGYGIGDGFLVGGWQCGVGDAMRKRETEEREEKKIIKNNKETLFK